MNKITKAHKILSLLLAAALLASIVSIASFADSETIPHNSNGFVLQNGKTYNVSRLVNDGVTQVKNLIVADGATVTINIEDGAWLTAIGDDGADGCGGKAGIYLPYGSTLILTGEGTLYARGGKGGHAARGGFAYDAYTFKSGALTRLHGGDGGLGGQGAGGGGAGIGTHGADGGAGGKEGGHGCIENGTSNTSGDPGSRGGTSMASGVIKNYGVKLTGEGGPSGDVPDTADDWPALRNGFKKVHDVVEWADGGRGGHNGLAGLTGSNIGSGGPGGGGGDAGKGGGGHFVTGILSTVDYSSDEDLTTGGSPGAYGSSGTYYYYDRSNTGVPGGTGDHGSNVVYLSKINISVFLDGNKYENKTVSMFNSAFGTYYGLEGTGENTGIYSCYVPKGNYNYFVYVDGVDSGKTINTNSNLVEQSVYYNTAILTIKNNGAAWDSASVSLYGNSTYLYPKYNSSGTHEGKYTYILRSDDETVYQLYVNGYLIDDTIQISDETNRTASADFFEPEVKLKKDNNPWTAGASVALKQDGVTVKLLKVDNTSQSFKSAAIPDGLYDVFVYGSVSDENINQQLSLTNSAITSGLEYYTVEFIRNLAGDNVVYKSSVLRSGDTPQLPSSPYQPGYTFLGWKTTAAGTVVYTPSAITSKTTVYGKWDVPVISIGASIRCTSDGSISNTGDHFFMPNIQIQGYPQTGNVISAFSVRLSNVVQRTGSGTTSAAITTSNGDVVWTREEQTVNGTGQINYVSQDNKITVAEAQVFLRSLLYKLYTPSQEGSVQIFVYGDTNN